MAEIWINGVCFYCVETGRDSPILGKDQVQEQRETEMEPLSNRNPCAEIRLLNLPRSQQEYDDLRKKIQNKLEATLGAD